jgi:RimJ/RimL family protein N-acetyltransferase
MHDKEITKFYSFDGSDYTTQTALDFIAKSHTDDKSIHLAITDDKDDEYLGTISLQFIDKKNSNAMYSTVLRTKAQGKGVAKQAVIKILKYAFEDLGLHKIHINILDFNARSITFHEKLGFEYEGTIRQHLYKNGKFNNLKLYGLFKKDFLKMYMDKD